MLSERKRMWKVPEISMENEVKKPRMPVIKLRYSRDLLENKSLSMKLKKNNPYSTGFAQAELGGEFSMRRHQK